MPGVSSSMVTRCKHWTPVRAQDPRECQETGNVHYMFGTAYPTVPGGVYGAHAQHGLYIALHCSTFTWACWHKHTDRPGHHIRYVKAMRFLHLV